MKNPEHELQNLWKPDYSGMTCETFAYGSMEGLLGVQETQLADRICSKQQPKGPMPVVILLHGGGFMQPCDRRVAYISFYAKYLTREGYAVVSADYPLYPEGTNIADPETEARACARAAQAVQLLYQYLHLHAKQLGLDIGRIALMGSSAGSMAALSAAAANPELYRCVIACWGVPLIISPQGAFPPVFSVHGTEDEQVPYERERPLLQILKQQGISYEHIALEGAGHTPLHLSDQFMPRLLAFLAKYL